MVRGPWEEPFGRISLTVDSPIVSDPDLLAPEPPMPRTTTPTARRAGPALLLLPLLASVSVADDFDPAPYARRAEEHPGDPGRGRAVFLDEDRARCSRCHAVGGQGGTIGPDLSNVGGKLGRDHLIESVLEPSRQLVEGYRPSLVALADGRVLTGIVAGDRDGALVLVDAEAAEHLVPLDQVEERATAEGSLMPDDLAASLTPEEFSDLIAYLGTLRAAGQPSPGAGVAGPSSLPPGFRQTVVAEGLTGAVALAVAPDGRVFVCEQPGRLRVVKDGALLSEPFLTLENVDDYWERGLIGVALDPDFERNGFAYVVYVSATPYPRHRVSRFTADGDRAAAGSEVVLFEGDDQRQYHGHVIAGHQGGGIRFGPDGKLYVGIGEHTDESQPQRLDSLLGKILRLNPDGTIPADNPFDAEAEGKYRSIWALGLRNPFTFAFQPGTGRLLINDIGANKYEEVNPGVPGGNYGWPRNEGPSGDDRYVDPVHWYPHASAAGAAFCPVEPVPGGFPARYRGRYFFNDFVNGWTATLDPADPRRPIPAETFAVGLARPVDLAFAPDGTLYVLLRDAWVRDDHFRPGTGSLLAIRYVGEPGAERPTP